MAAKKQGGRCVVVGAGIAGLSAARTLREGGMDVLVLEREATIGGRMSTLTFSGGVFDHGAQFFTVKDERFQPLIDQWTEHGVVQDWFHSQLISGGSSNPDGFPRYCGTEGMSSLIEDLAEGLEIRTEADVTGLEVKGRSCTLTLADGETINADAVILTAPVPQSLDLLEKNGLQVNKRDKELLEGVEYSKCITLLAVLDTEKSGLTEWGGLRISGDYIDWIADNHLKGISEKCAVTIQTVPEFSLDYWDNDNQDIANRLLDNAKALLLAPAIDWKVFRWEYAKPLKVHPYSHIAVKGAPTCLLAGDGFQGYRVEGAAISGMEAGQSILRQFS
ncbi:FAD-dependent oxidoreductase [bacterium]|nr:FAD-dependent oxidoreductase [bacterium]